MSQIVQFTIIPEKLTVTQLSRNFLTFYGPEVHSRYHPTYVSYILEDLPHIKIENTYGHENTRESSWNQNTMDPDRPQQDCPTAYVIAQ